MDSTDVSHWMEKVHDPAVQIVQDYMNVSLCKMNFDMLCMKCSVSCYKSK